MRFSNVIRGTALAAGVVAMAGMTPAWAHKVLMDVYADGSAVVGELGFSDGSMAQGATVEVLDAKGNKLAEVKTDAKGVFRYVPTKKEALSFRSNLGAGHMGFADMSVDDLPENIGGAASEAAPAAASTAAASTEAAAPAATAAVPDDLTQIIGKEVRRNVKPLREMIYKMKEKNDLQAILGGIGYILGIFGVGFYVAARCKYRKGV